MRIQIESTRELIEINGAPGRLWEGKTESGIPILCYVTLIAVKEGQPESVYAEFESELTRQHPKPATECIDLRLLL